MNFNMNIVICALLLSVSQSGHAVYLYDWDANKDSFFNYVPEYGPTPRQQNAKQSKEKLSPARPPVEHYGGLTARLLGLPKEDSRTIGMPFRPMSAPVDRKNTPIKPCPAARKPCFITNGCLVYRLDQRSQQNRAVLQGGKNVSSRA